MNIKAFAKINLSLDITGIRNNGYHDVRMVMQNLELCDEILLEKKEEKGISLSVADERGGTDTKEICRPQVQNNPGTEIPADKDNLMFRAADMLMKKAGTETGISMKLIKRIPAAAGLAGGSADAAAVFRGVNELLGLGFSTEELMEMGAALGADIPYCILGGTALAEGIGERLTAVSTGLRPYVLLVKPELGLSTPAVYKAYDRALAGGVNIAHPDVDAMVTALSQNSISDVCANLGNVLEYAVIPDVPLINEIKKDMIIYGAEASLMTGSGSTVFGLFEDWETMASATAHFNSVPYIGELSDIIQTRFL